MEAVGSAAPLKPYGQRYEWRKALGIGFIVLEPFQQAKGQIEDVDALLFLQGFRVVPNVQ